MYRVLAKTMISLFAAGLSCAADRQVTKKEFGKDWPLMVEAGTLSCIGNAVTFSVNGAVYAVNGTATGRKLGKDIGPIWAAPPAEWLVDPKTKERINLAPPKKSIGALVDAGLALCK
jgi:hypothetical protein